MDGRRAIVSAAMRVTKTEAEQLLDAVGNEDTAELVRTLQAVLTRLISAQTLEWEALVAAAAAVGRWTPGRADAVRLRHFEALEQLAVDLNELRVIGVDG